MWQWKATSIRMGQTLAGAILLNGTGHLKNVNNCLNSNIYSYLETSGGQSYNLYLNVVPFFQPQC
jgi:hypothetical protein